MEFKRAYVLLPRATVLYNIGQAEFQLQEYAQALSTLERFLAETGPNAARRAEVQETVEILRGRVGQVLLNSDRDGCEVTLDEQSVGSTPLAKPIPVSIGRRRVVVSCPGGERATRDAEVASGQTVALDVRLGPAPSASSGVAETVRAPVSAPVGGRGMTDRVDRQRRTGDCDARRLHRRAGRVPAAGHPPRPLSRQCPAAVKPGDGHFSSGSGGGHPRGQHAGRGGSHRLLPGERTAAGGSSSRRGRDRSGTGCAGQLLMKGADVQSRNLYQLLLPLQLLVAASGFAVGGCSLLVDDTRGQCRIDSDCFKFGNYPYCVQGVCAPSGLGPTGCVLGTPASQDDYGNACSIAKCIPFDNCGRLSSCGAEVSSRGALIPPAGLGTRPTAGQRPASAGALNCADPSRPNIIYVTGSTNFWPLAQAVQPLLSARNPPYTLVYQPQTSCRGAGIHVRPRPDETGHQGHTRATGPVSTTSKGSEPTAGCAQRVTSVDVGQSDVFARTCGFEPVPNVADYVGPIQAITFVVPAASTQTSISAEAAHFVFGAGGNQGGIPPWTDPNLFFVRSSGHRNHPAHLARDQRPGRRLVGHRSVVLGQPA